ncbi:MAG TPA: hypothetical protein VGS23_01775 [Thermoplasmata archaeon]|nr:hypothetical protein [Thermoplasmata archaeon]
MSEFVTENAHLLERGPRVRVRITSGGPSSVRGAARSAVDTDALVDTGSGRSLLHRDIPRALGLEPVGAVEVDSVTSTDVPTPEFDVRFWFDDSLSVPVRALATPLPVPQLRAVVGRDALAHLRFTYDGPGSRFVLSG